MNSVIASGNEAKEGYNGYANMLCACGQPVAFNKVFEDHLSACTQFQSKFGELLAALINTAKKVKDKNDYNIIKYMFHIQKFQIRKVLKQAMAPPKVAPESRNPLLMSFASPPPPSLEEEKIRRSVAIEPSQRMEGALDNSDEHSFARSTDLIICTQCNRQFPEKSNVIGLSCGHNYCHSCMKHKAFKEYPETGQLFCNCKAAVKETEMKVKFHCIVGCD